MGLGTSACSSQTNNSSSKQTTTSRSKKSVEKTDENSSESISDVAEISMSVINRCPVIKETYFLNDSLDTFPYVLSSYKTFKERTKVKVDEEEADKENKMNVVIKLDKEKKIVKHYLESM